MFAIAIWNQRDRSLFVARDRLGIKPLHYFFDGRRFVFGSEIKAILRHPAVMPTIDWTAADAFFTYGFVPAPWTIYREIQKLRPGYFMIVDERGLREERYWDVSFEQQADRVAGRHRGGVPGALARIGGNADAQRSAARRVPERRRGLEPGRRADGPGVAIGRSRRSRSASAAAPATSWTSVRSRGRSASATERTTRSSKSSPRSRRRSTSRSTRSTSRSPTTR